MSDEVKLRECLRCMHLFAGAMANALDADPKKIELNVKLSSKSMPAEIVKTITLQKVLDEAESLLNETVVKSVEWEVNEE